MKTMKKCIITLSFVHDLSLAWLVISAAASGCRGDECRLEPQVHEQIYPMPVRAVPNVLFVVDNSPSMIGKLPVIKKEIRRWVGENLQWEYKGRDYRLALLTTSLVSEGCPVCGPAVPAPCLLETLDDGRLRPWNGKRFFGPGEEESFLAALDAVEANGCPYERGLEAIRLALSPPRSEEENAGFLRGKDYMTLIFIISDEDDCGKPGDVPESAAQDEQSTIEACEAARDNGLLENVITYQDLLESLESYPVLWLAGGVDNRREAVSCTLGAGCSEECGFRPLSRYLEAALGLSAHYSLGCDEQFLNQWLFYFDPCVVCFLDEPPMDENSIEVYVNDEPVAHDLWSYLPPGCGCEESCVPDACPFGAVQISDELYRIILDPSRDIVFRISYLTGYTFTCAEATEEKNRRQGFYASRKALWRRNRADLHGKIRRQ